MAIFNRKQNKPEEKKVDAKPAAAKASVKKTAALPKNLASVLKKPRVTEKAVAKSEKNVYTFEIDQNATKNDVKAAVKAIYNVTPAKVNIVKKSPRSFVSRTRGRRVSEKGLKKAYVYLKSGDSISLV